jgi:hypothetical protein
MEIMKNNQEEIFQMKTPVNHINPQWLISAGKTE